MRAFCLLTEDRLGLVEPDLFPASVEEGYPFCSELFQEQPWGRGCLVLGDFFADDTVVLAPCDLGPSADSGTACI